MKSKRPYSTMFIIIVDVDAFLFWNISKKLFVRKYFCSQNIFSFKNIYFSFHVLFSTHKNQDSIFPIGCNILHSFCILRPVGGCIH